MCGLPGARRPRALVLIELLVALLVVRLLAELADDLLGVGDPEAVAVGEADGLRERRAPVAVRFSCGRVSLLRCFLNVLSSLRSSAICGSSIASSPVGQILLERIERVTRPTAWNARIADPVLDLGVARPRSAVCSSSSGPMTGCVAISRKYRASIESPPPSSISLSEGAFGARRARRPRSPAPRPAAASSSSSSSTSSISGRAGRRAGPERAGRRLELVVDRRVDRARRLLDRGRRLRDGRAALALAHDRCSLARGRVRRWGRYVLLLGLRRGRAASRKRCRARRRLRGRTRLGGPVCTFRTFAPFDGLPRVPERREPRAVATSKGPGFRFRHRAASSSESSSFVWMVATACGRHSVSSST